MYIVLLRDLVNRLHALGCFQCNLGFLRDGKNFRLLAITAGLFFSSQDQLNLLSGFVGPLYFSR